MEDVITIALKGQNRKAIGSNDYFGILNAGILAGLMQDYKKCNYCQALQKSADRIHSALEEIFQDLKTNIGILRYIPLADRKDLIHVIEGYTGLCKIASKSTGKSADCIAMLNLSNAKTRPVSKASESALDTAVKTMRGYSGLSSSERLDVAKKVVTRGAAAAAGNNAKRALFLKQAEQGKGSDFLSDACLKFLYVNSPNQFAGRCGRPVCSDVYILHFKKRIFFHDVPKNVLNNSKTYDKMVLEQFKDIAEQIEKDLAAGQRKAEILSPNYRKRLLESAKELDHFLHSNLHGKIQKYFQEIPLEDVTDRLHQQMVATDALYERYARPAFYQSDIGSIEFSGNDPAAKIAAFILNVKNDSPIDIKRSSEWSSKWYIYEDDIIRYDATGNILFGYVGKVFGYDDEFLCLGAGMYQLLTGPRQLDFIASYGDDPYDTKMIRKGITYYNKTH